MHMNNALELIPFLYEHTQKEESRVHAYLSLLNYSSIKFIPGKKYCTSSFQNKTEIFSIVYFTIHHDQTKYMGYGNSSSNRETPEHFFYNIVRTTQRDNSTFRWKSKCWKNYFDPSIPRETGNI